MSIFEKACASIWKTHCTLCGGSGWNKNASSAWFGAEFYHTDAYICAENLKIMTKEERITYEYVRRG